MSSENDPIIAEFVVESREHLADVENQLLAIEAAGANVDLDLVNEVFRAVHSIKGASGFLGFSKLGELAHSLENVLNLIRNRELIADTAITDTMLRAADTLRGMLVDIQKSNDVDVSRHVAELQAVVSVRPATESPSPLHGDPTHAAFSPTEKSTESVPAATGDASIRVSVSLLDSLMTLAGELVLSRNRLLQAVGSADGASLDSVAARLDQVTSELQEAIMQTRMQLIGTVFSKFPRVVRDLSNQLGKQCRLTLEGEDVELDKSIIEAIGDPLTHLIRNSVDHGIESPQDRAQAGKPAAGTIVLRAFHQAGKVNISISDDGAGIKTAKVKEKAIAGGLITPERASEMGDREALRLIFHPGFSLAAKVTGVSGRGVGMDVVKTNIEKLGGAVAIDTQIGAGTTISVKLPLTLAIIPSLIVRCRGNRFAIPQASISELVRIKADDVANKIERVQQADVFRLRGKLLPLVRLDRTLGLDQQPNREQVGPLNIIIVETGHLQYGLVVDGLHDSEEIVVKPLGRHMQDCHCLAGVTILGDGRVALILDVAGIASCSELTLPEDDQRPGMSEPAADGDEENQRVLLFTNDPAEQFGIPMEVITRLERVRSDQVDTVGGHEVLQYRGTTLPLLCLEKYIHAHPRPDIDKIYVVVFAVLNREVGLIVPTLVDVRDVSTDVDTVTFREPGIVGSVEVDHKAMRLLDLYELTELAHPKWFAGRETVAIGSPSVAAECETGRGVPTILLAEDSGFFRKQLAGFLEKAGYQVVDCDDGQTAWNTLQERGSEVDLVVTDIEMPNMDGCQLARHIKDDPALAHLPVIAVTSLASDEDMQRGIRSGIDDYQVKLDRERLLAAVADLLRDAEQRAHSTNQSAATSMGSPS